MKGFQAGVCYVLVWRINLTMVWRIYWNWGKFEEYKETIMEIYIKDDPILNWPGDTDNKKKIDLKVIEQMEVFGDWK